MTCNEKLEAYLREQGVPFEKQRHAIAFTAQEVAASASLPKSFATVMLARCHHSATSTAFQSMWTRR